VSAAAARGTSAPALGGPTESSGKALLSLIFGILFLFFPAALTAVVLGHLSLSEIGRSAGRITGRGMAIVGLVLGYIGISIVPVLIIAAIAIPNLLRSRMAANEASAVGSLRTISTAAVNYSAAYQHGFPASLEALGPAPGGEKASEKAAGLIDNVLASGRRSGYVIRYESSKPTSEGSFEGFSVYADPDAPGSTGQRHFFIDETAVIRLEMDRPASRDSPPIE